jgi:hypothetical protein
MITRRVFLSSVACAAIGIDVIQRTQGALGRGPVLRVATVVDPARGAFQAGLDFGAAEADRSTSLFGWRVETVAIPATQPETLVLANASALIVASDVAIEPLPTLTLNASCRARAGAFQLIPDGACDAGASDSTRVELWQASLRAFGAEQLNDRFRAHARADMTSDSWLGWFSMKLLAESALRAKTVDSARLAEYLRAPATQFDGHKGEPLRFGPPPRRELLQPVYRMSRAGAGS